MSKAQPAAEGDPNTKDTMTHSKARSPQQAFLPIKDTRRDDALKNHTYVGIGSEKTVETLVQEHRFFPERKQRPGAVD